MNRLVFVICFLFSCCLFAQTDINPPSAINTVQSILFQGEILDATNNTPLEFATIYIPAFNASAISDKSGQFSLSMEKPTEPSNISVLVNYIGYKELKQDILYQNITDFHSFSLSPNLELIEEVIVKGTTFKDVIGVPVSLKTTSSSMIQSNAGGGGDFTKIMQSLPGLTTINSFRNDLVVRGGSPTENTFFIDDIEIPYINHLSTQGSTGGTISILNAQLINEVDFIASGFPANRPDAMSGVFNIYLTDPFKEKKLVIGTDPNNLFINGATAYKDNATSFSIRKSYRELILKQIGLAVLPSYSDYLLNMRHRFNQKSYLSFLLVGSIDNFKVNQDINDSEVQQYLRDNLPVNQQSSTTAGLVYKYISDKNSVSVRLSGANFTNAAQKSNLISGQKVDKLDFYSRESQFTGVVENYQDLNLVQLKYGAGFKTNKAFNIVKNQYFNANGLNQIDYRSRINYTINHVFLQATYNVVPSVLQVTLHSTFQYSNVKNEGWLYSAPIPRLNGKLSVLPTMDINFSIGEYRQLPENILLSYLENSDYVNRENTKFIKSQQAVIGLELLKENKQNQVTVEGFYKGYSNYPFNRREKISLANFGADFGVVGNVPIDFSGKGRAYGMELFFKRTNTKKLSGWVSYSLSKSEFLNEDRQYVVSSWDARHILNGVVAYRINKNWSASLNAKFQSALPYTPFDIESSSFVPVWDVNRIGIRDFTKLNTMRGKSTTLIDLRIQRSLTWKTLDMTFYLDFENILVDADSQQVLVLDQDSDNMPVVLNPLDIPSLQRYRLKELKNAEGVFIPSFGLVIKIL